MATRKQRKTAPGKQGSDTGGLASKAQKAKARAEKLHARADAVHERTHGVHRASHAAHLKVSALKKERRNAAEGGAGIARPPKTGVKELDLSRKGAPVMRASLGAPPASQLPFTIVGVGASAGGYEAFTNFVTHLNNKTGMAFVLIQHLDPNHPSHLAELLKKASPVPVVEITHGLKPQPNHLYVMPSNVSATLFKGRFKLTARPPAPAVAMPIDVFFRSLAIEQEHRAIAIILSGTGSDGTLGVAEIKGQGGITFAQDQGTAKHFGMPGSGISSGHIDFVLSPDAIAEELGRLAGHPYVAPAAKTGADPHATKFEWPATETILKPESGELKTLFLLLRTRTGVDFSLYKPGTLNRRILRRMVLQKIDNLPRYLSYLQENPTEVDALFNDLLISVTGFFRDPDSFETLQKKILPKILRARTDDSPIRVWSCGCSTGEEAYSLAMVVSEFLEKAGRHLPVQIFASDLNQRGIEHARSGIFHENILLDVSRERLRRYFVKADGFYHVIKPVRDMCVFARQNIVADPPFSNLDLISCRNVLIYLTPVLQNRIIPTFHYALKPHGFLLLGSSESIGAHSELFELVDKKHKIFVRKATAYRPNLELTRFTPHELVVPSADPSPPRHDGPGPNLQDQVDRLILTKLSPSSVVIDAQMDVVQFRGQTGKYLEHHSGAASLNLLKMAREGLALDLRRAVAKAVQTGERVEQHRARIRDPHGQEEEITIEIHPLHLGSDGGRFFLVVFKPAAPADLERGPRTGAQKRSREMKRAEAHRIATLEDELRSTKESLQAIIEEQEATNEELKSANEEIQASNEELQSTNEELGTAREELQSTNEELTTLNQELQTRNAELGQVNNDLLNILNSVNIPLLILGNDLAIRRFTPAAEKLFNLMPSDIGRRLSDLAPNIQVPELDVWLNEVLQNLTMVQREVQDREGRWYSLRIRPYRTQEDHIAGVILMLVDIDELKLAIRHFMFVVQHPIIALSSDLRVSWANPAFYDTFQVGADETEGRHIYRLGDGQWNIPELRSLLEEVLPSRQDVRNFRVEHNFPAIGQKAFNVSASRLYNERRGVSLIMVSFDEAPNSGGASA